MTVQQYCLRWNNHQPNFISVFSSLLNSQSLVDVTLAAEGKQLQAHKVVLSACSSYFQSLFATNPCKHPIVILKDVKFTDLRVLVDFMYHGEVSVSQEQLPCILKTAEMLKIKGLTEIPMENPTVKCESQLSSEKSEMSSQSTDHWSLEETRPISPSSPSTKRRRLKKNVICNPTITTEPPEVPPNEILLSTADVFETVLKPDEARSIADTSQKYNGIPIASIQPSTSHQTHQREAEPTHQIITQVTPPQDVTVNTSQSLDCSQVELSRTCTTSQPTTGIQWNVLDQSGFTHFSSTSAVISNNVGTQFTHNSESHPTSPPNNNILLHSNTTVNEPFHTLKKKRSLNPQGDENFLRALEAVRFGGIGFCKAARMYGVNNRTLWLEYKKRGYPNFRLSIKNRHQTQVQGQSDRDDKSKDQSIVTSEPDTCTVNPIAIISSAVFDGKHVDFKEVSQRSKYFDSENPPETINFQSLNLDPM
ncbi:longitudinals lacking protein, isoforms H/M/V-like isoform X1 [Diabrotica virgifera virgifera]|uniref:BTB domain-containing protein n=1 Tax=Diabrotica virgifera virgifera TaxID=50390 RepID=A0ABM5JR64_DIAVI|nr:longitudinals lacking protein, isoforms H/M/V-like isoform X1 [Diabrotica virgifera virgifera]XP_050500431.1 longitudinals lacking protein, isoforms H/M/V-like isoform X1 [Diabrotica virgifera virgifera]XP_050500432.1 longitudinals lacking protein, isoforms H/M/V-like isoform X1 [Diabrotica virgifera virgifera]XP_050500433.1 longitudinals lacking protein, isoforms H/M/V-like isoform X1 [Diabrotica virgifera virgifera]